MASPVDILIVDHESAVRALVTHWLRSWGYHVTQAVSALDTLELMTTEPARIMLIDVALPGLDGFWLAEQVRTHWPRTAVVMVVTDDDDVQAMRQIRRAGAVGFVRKPLDEMLLRQALDRAITQRPPS